MFKARPVHFMLIVLILAFTAVQAGAQDKDSAGKFIFVHGKVQVISPQGVLRTAEKGDVVYEKDTIRSDSDGSAQLLMMDGAYIALRPNSEIRLDAYRYHPQKEEAGKSVITLLKGCFRSITGMIGKKNKEDYRIKTPVANIGIRGTDHEPLYIPEPVAGEIPMGVPGLYDKVNSGETYIENETGRVVIMPNEVGYVSTTDAQPVLIDQMPDYYQTLMEPSSSDASTPSDQEENEQFADTSSETLVAENSGSVEEITQPISAQDSDGNIYDLTENTQVVPTPEQTQTPSLPAPQVYVGGFTWPDLANFGTTQFAVLDTAIQTGDNGDVVGWDFGTMLHPDPLWTRSIGLIGYDASSATYQQAGHFDETGIAFGTMSATAVRETYYDGSFTDFPVNSGLVHWINGPAPSPDYISQVLTGSANYTLDGWTSPTNQDGIQGVLNSADLTVNFTSQSVSAGVDVTVNSHNWVAQATNLPLDQNHFFAIKNNPPTFTVLLDGVDTPTSWGALNGSLTGDALNGAWMAYTFGDTGIGESVNGVAAFQGVSQNTATAYRTIGFASLDPRPIGTWMAADHSSNNAGAVSTDASSNVTGFYAALVGTRPGGIHDPVRFDVGTATLTDTGTDPATQISWGRWSGAGIDATDRLDGTPLPPFSDLHYVAGPETNTPVGLPVSGTYTYNRVGGTNPTDNLGNTGTLNSASLTANFSEMTVATALDLDVGGVHFNADASGVPIAGTGFRATHQDALNVTSSTGSIQQGIVSGAFHGASAQGAGMVYSLRSTDNLAMPGNIVSGAVAFGR